MLVAILISVLTLMIFKLLSFTKARVKVVQDEIFQSTQISLRKAQQKISAKNLSSIGAKKAFDKCARQIMYQSAQLAYGDEAAIPMNHYTAFKEEAKYLKKKFNRGIRSYRIR